MKLSIKVTLLLGTLILSLKGFPQNAWTVTEICVPGSHIDECNIKLPFMDTRSKEAVFFLDLVLDNDTLTKTKMVVNEVDTMITKVSVEIQGKQAGQKLMKAITSKFSNPLLTNHNLVVEIYKWEFPEGVVNYLEHNKLSKQYKFISQTK
jgi:primase-polymerase (primpol)-like protein